MRGLDLKVSIRLQLFALFGLLLLTGAGVLAHPPFAAGTQ